MFTQRHFEELAAMIRSDHSTFTYDVAVRIADRMAALNSKFKRGLFMQAAGWEHAPDTVAVAA